MEKVNDPLYEKCGVTHDEVARHFGLEPSQVYGNPDVYHGTWPREEAIRGIGFLSELEFMVDPKKKIRIEFHYDPDYPAALDTVSERMKNAPLLAQAGRGQSGSGVFFVGQAIRQRGQVFC